MTGSVVPLFSAVDGASVDAILDSGASGLQYFGVFLPRATVVDPSIGQNYAGVCALYDLERGMNLDVLVRDGDRISGAARALDAELQVQDGCLADVQMSWQGAAADSADRQLLAMNTRAASLTSALAEISKAHVAAADLLRSVISTKAQFVAVLDPSNIGGKTVEQIDAMIEGSTSQGWNPNSGIVELLAGALPNLGYLAFVLPGGVGGELYRAQAAEQCRNWLDTVFVPDVMGKLAAFSDLCQATGVAVQQSLDVVTDAMLALDDSPFRVETPRSGSDGAGSDGAGSDGAGGYGAGGFGAGQPTAGQPGKSGSGGWVPPSTAPAGAGAIAPSMGGICPEPATSGPAAGAQPEVPFATPLNDELVKALTGVVKSATGAAEALVQAVLADVNNPEPTDGEGPRTSPHPPEADVRPVEPAPPAPPASPAVDPARLSPGAELGHIEADVGGYGARLSLLADGHVEFTTSIPQDGHSSPVPTAPDADPAPAVVTTGSAFPDEPEHQGLPAEPTPPNEPESGSAAQHFTGTDDVPPAQPDTPPPAPAATQPDARLAEAGSL